MKYISPNEMTRDPDVEKALKTTINFAIQVASAAAHNKIPKDIFNGNTLKTLEGDRKVNPSDVILFQRKGKGKYWAVDIATFRDGFKQIESNDPLTEEGWVAVTPKDYVRAWKIENPFKVKVSWGEQESEPYGGWLVQKINNPSDFWICSFEDFKNYEVIK